MFSQTVEYALRAMVYLAEASPGTLTTGQIAERTLVPRPYLSKVLQGLVRGKLVRSQRGIGGGISLARPPNKITILDVVSAVDPIRRIQTCPLGLETHGKRLCPLHKRLDMALAAVENAFGATTLAEILAEPSKSKPLCNIPQ